MTNPSGICAPWVSVNNVAPLWPRIGGRPDDRHLRDSQVFPRHVRDIGDSHQTLHRTAAVKHHLRGMADRADMLTTYEHDFGFMVRDRPLGGLSPATPAADRRLISRHSSAPSVGSTRSASSAGRRSPPAIIRSERRDPASTMWPPTNTKLRSLSGTSAPMRLNCSGWGDARWSALANPSMIHGMTKKQTALVQMTNILNLRAPDLPFSTR
mmetsp:Transcript_32594/g.95403  ORF Transcript_32594/g.95403 Transcript_32594/m.95403 type:complete len:211 (+) Transcript_32594:124-756(+)